MRLFTGENYYIGVFGSMSDLEFFISPDQHWGLMPLHAVCSTVRPASFFYGTGAHYGGSNPIAFPQYVLGTTS